jgi:putative inorganic carbon (HCO3(-)) transporter
MIGTKSNFFSESENWIKLSVIVVLLVSCIGLPLVALTVGTVGPILFLIAIIAPLALFGILKYPKLGIAIYLIMAYWIMFIMNFGVNFPLGTLMDALLLLLIFGFFMEQKYHPNWKIFHNPISVVIVLWILYNFAQAANPQMASILAWVYTIRAIAGVTISYFIFTYHIDSIKMFRSIINVWLVFTFLAALYAIKQEFWGFFDFEQRALDLDPRLQSLLFIDGHWRKSSIFADPVSFSYNMVVSSIICVVLAFGTRSVWKKVLLSALAILCLNVMLYSGTRAAYVLFPAAMFLFAILKLNKQILIFSVFFFIFFIVLVRLPTSNPNLSRFQSAFRPNNDASYNVRKQNQKLIQPFIQSHPIGGGLGSTGASGVRFSDGTFLSRFPPDSGYVRAAVELGWIGLALLCTLTFLAIKTGIDNYFKIIDPELKNYCLAMTLILFALAVGNFPQEGILQFPLNIYFYLTIALINIALRLDIKKNPRSNTAI